MSEPLPAETGLEPSRSGVAPPPGYRPMRLSDPFEAYVGPFFERIEEAEEDALTCAFFVDDRHMNGGGFLHGGMLMTFADAALGALAWRAVQRRPTVTLSMQVDFIKGVRQGDLVECRASLTRRTRSILFVRGTFLVTGEPVGTASSLWKLLGA